MICNNCGNVVDSINRFCPRCGAAMQFPSPDPATPPPYRAPQQAPMPMTGGYPPPKKSGCGKIFLILLLILLVVAGGISLAVYFGYRYTEKALKSSEAYTLALNALKENVEVKEQMGEIQGTGFPLGGFKQNSDGSGQAGFVMSVQGTKMNGKYDVSMTRSNGIWILERGLVHTDGGRTIVIVTTPVVMGDPVSRDSNRNTNTGNVGNVNAKNPSNGVILNDKAIALPKPLYPATARAAHAAGTVIVQIMVNEEGNVESASAISGHPLLRAAAESAARHATFPLTMRSGKPVKVSGILKYEFTAE